MSEDGVLLQYNYNSTFEFNQQYWQQYQDEQKREIESIQNQLYENMIQTHYNNKNGLSASHYRKLKIMKMVKSKKECSVCVSQFCKDELIVRLPCKHIFHEECIKPWLKTNTKCPYCRFDIKQHFKSLKNQETIHKHNDSQ